MSSRKVRSSPSPGRSGHDRTASRVRPSRSSCWPSAVPSSTSADEADHCVSNAIGREPVPPVTRSLAGWMNSWTDLDAVVVGMTATHPTAASASSPSRIRRRAAKRSEAAGGIVGPLIDGIRASGFCGARFRHVRAWATSDSVRSAPHWRHRWQPLPISVPSCSGVYARRHVPQSATGWSGHSSKSNDLSRTNSNTTRASSSSGTSPVKYRQRNNSVEGVDTGGQRGTTEQFDSPSRRGLFPPAPAPRASRAASGSVRSEQRGNARGRASSTCTWSFSGGTTRATSRTRREWWDASARRSHREHARGHVRVLPLDRP